MSTNNRLLLSSKINTHTHTKDNNKSKTNIKKNPKTIQNFKESLAGYQQTFDCLCGLLG